MPHAGANPERLSLDDIDAGVFLVEEKSALDARDLLEIEDVEKRKLENKLAKAKIKDVKADRRLRKTYANRILRFLELYSTGVALIIVASATKYNGFSLDKEVIVTLVGSTAVAAIGLVGFIARGLFRPPPTPKD